MTFPPQQEVINSPTITVQKLDHTGKLVTSYEGQVIYRDVSSIVLDARWRRERLELPYVVFEPGDRLVESFFTDRWYNIFQVYAGSNGQLKGWYCNVSRPAVLNNNVLSAVDLVLDLFVHPNGKILLLDEDEFRALNLYHNDLKLWRKAIGAVVELKTMVAMHCAPFEALTTP